MVDRANSHSAEGWQQTHEIIVHSITANRETKKERKEMPPPTKHTDIQNYSQDINGHWMPSLENWGGGLCTLAKDALMQLSFTRDIIK